MSKTPTYEDLQRRIRELEEKTLRLNQEKRRLKKTAADLENKLKNLRADGVSRQTPLARDNAEWREVFDILNDMITVHDRDFNIIRANKAAERMLGLSLPRILASKCHVAYHGENEPPARCPSCQTARTGQASTTEFHEPHLQKFLEIKALPRFDKAGQLIGVVHVARDISDRKQAEQEISHQLEFTRLLGSISTKFINLGLECIDEEISRALGEIAAFVGVDRGWVFRFSADGSRLASTHEWCGPDLKSQRPLLQNILPSRLSWLFPRLFNAETINIPTMADLPAEADEERKLFRQLRLNSLLLVPKIHNGRLVGLVGYGAVRQRKEWRETDVTNLKVLTDIFTHALERKRAEEALRESEERFRQLTDNIEAVFWIYSPDESKMLYVSPAYETIWGRTCQSLYERPTSWQEAILRQDCTRIKTSFRSRRRQSEDIYRIARPDNTIRWIRDRAFPLRGSATGEIYRVVGIAEDITRLKETESQLKQQYQQLMQADKMIALGTLVSGVAHEINNPNNFIMLNTPLLKEAWENALPILDGYHREHGEFLLGGVDYTEMREAVPMLINGIKEGANRIKTIVSDLKDFSRKDTAQEFRPVEINTVIRAATTLVSNLTKHSTRRFSIAYGPDLPPISGNAQQLEQVVINLIQNACQALTDMDQAVRVRTTFDGQSGQIIIAVSDEGVGIAPEILPAIGDPFFTTKRDTGGTGLGLSISARIVHEHRGTLNFTSLPGKGTTATVRLPVMVNGNNR